jgi:hypothetical protein
VATRYCVLPGFGKHLVLLGILHMCWAGVGLSARMRETGEGSDGRASDRG